MKSSPCSKINLGRSSKKKQGAFKEGTLCAKRIVIIPFRGANERDSELTPAEFLIMILQYFTSGIDLNKDGSLE
jgi:hypothetical protein